MIKETPIVVDPSPAKDQIATATRDVALLLAALPALIAFFGKRDVIGLVNYLASAEGATVLGILVAGGVMGWRQVHARRTKAKFVTVAAAAPDRVAIVETKS